MPVDQVVQFVPAFVLIFFRLAGMMIFAPLFGSAQIPRRLRALLVLVLAFSLTGSVPGPARLPATPWELAVGIGGEMAFGVAMGMILSFAFIAVQWAGEMIGQQMGLNLSETFDPQFGAQSSLVGELYFMLCLVVFLTLRGHHAMLRGVRASFEALPLLSLRVDQNLLNLLVGLFQGATELALQLAAPMFVTMLVVDVALGFIGKTMPQINVMSAGMTLRSLIGLGVLAIGLTLTSDVMRNAVMDSMQTAWMQWTTPR